MKTLTRSLLSTATLLGLSFTAHAQVIYSDNFNRADGVLGNTSTGNYAWLTPGGTTSTDPATNTTFLIATNEMALRSPNNHANRQAYVDFNLDSIANYTATFSLRSGTFATGAAFLILPRAQGSDIVGDVGWMLSRGGTAGIYQYDGGARVSGNISTTGTSVHSFDQNTSYTFRIDVIGNTAHLFINGAETANSTLNLGSVAGNDIADSFMFGYNQTQSSQRNINVFVDDFVIIPEPSTLALLGLGLGGLLLLNRRRR